jgi:hypothetical protein
LRKNKKAARHTPNRLVKTQSLVRSRYRRRSFLRRLNADEAPVPPLILKLHDSGDQCEESVVLALSHVHSGLVLRAALPNQNGSSVHELTAKPLYSKSLSV